jgi:pyridoxal phosphate enzyme (YggS family)
VIDITENLAAVRARVRAAEQAAGRPAGSVTMVAVGKGQPAERLQSAAALGLTEFGENYLQEALPKIASLPDLSWHYIGNLQANKTRAIAERFAWAQTVTDARIAERLSRQRPYYAPPLQVCLQLRPAGTAARSGAPESDLPALATVVAGLPRLQLRGIMFMPLGELDEASLVAEFRRAAACLGRLQAAGMTVDTLSMGMSGDLEQAIAAGSTLVRVGTALFGPRPD